MRFASWVDDLPYHLGIHIRVVLLAFHSCTATNLEIFPSNDFSLDTFLMDPCRKAHFSIVQTTANAIGRAGSPAEECCMDCM